MVLVVVVVEGIFGEALSGKETSFYFLFCLSSVLLGEPGSLEYLANFLLCKSFSTVFKRKKSIWVLSI